MKFVSQRFSLADIGFGIIIVSYLLVVFSSSMPIQIGKAEMAMGAGLALGVSLAVYSLVGRTDLNLRKPLVCIAYFLLAPSIIGIVRGNSISDMARDIAPLLFLVVVPILMSLLPRDRNAVFRLRILLGAICTVGLVSALQFYNGMEQLFGSMDAYVSRVSRYEPIYELSGNEASRLSFMLRLFSLESTDYRMLLVKCLDPAVLFAAIYLLCHGLALVMEKPKHLFYGALALLGGGFCAYAFSALGMRAFGGLTVLALTLYALYLVKVKEVPVVNLVVVGVFALLLAHSQIATFAAQMWEKQQLAGISSRQVELYAVWDTVSRDVVTLLFGIGWGGAFSNPILSWEPTRFTHSLISFWMLKTGLFGFLVLVSFVTLLIRRIELNRVYISSSRLAIFLAVAAVTIIALFFEVTYKMLSFSMIMGLLLAELSVVSSRP